MMRPSVRPASLTDPGTGEEKKHYFAGGRRVAMRTGGTLRYLANDHLGSTAFVMSSAGALESHVRYYPYGMAWTQSAAPATDRLFTGHQQMGSRSGTYYANARFYSADIGRFPTPDSVVGGGYTYVGNNPTNYVDPTGHDIVPPCVCPGGGIGGGGGGGGGGRPPPGTTDPAIPPPPGGPILFDWFDTKTSQACIDERRSERCVRITDSVRLRYYKNAYAQVQVKACWVKTVRQRVPGTQTAQYEYLYVFAQELGTGRGGIAPTYPERLRPNVYYVIPNCSSELVNVICVDYGSRWLVPPPDYVDTIVHTTCVGSNVV